LFLTEKKFLSLKKSQFSKGVSENQPGEMKILIVGSGKLANALLEADFSSQPVERIKWDEAVLPINEYVVVVHAGSGRQLKECLDFCGRTKSPLIELSTGLGTEKIKPDFPLIICPNTSILLLKTLHALKSIALYFQNNIITITESHQSSKTSESATAHAFAKILNVPAGNIISIRDPEIQIRGLGIPEEYLNKLAFHRIQIVDGNDTVTIETKVLGHYSYAEGVRKIINAVIKHDFENRVHTVLDLIEANWL
jgi:4-hydroxy-tetrahydrodipicolinate reductase